MSFLKKNKIIIFVSAFIAILLTSCFFLCKCDKAEPVQVESDTYVVSSTIPETVEEEVDAPRETERNSTIQKEDKAVPKTSPEEKEPLAIQDKEEEVSDEDETSFDKTEKTSVCSISVKCNTILSNLESLPPEKVSLVPLDGIILPPIEAEISEGDTAFDILKRELKRRKIHMEFEEVPVYNSAYIEGIGNLYEFDCGELSGWIYRVNGKISSEGCSLYKVKDGDVIEFLYTCNMGRDL